MAIAGLDGEQFHSLLLNKVPMPSYAVSSTGTGHLTLFESINLAWDVFDPRKQSNVGVGAKFFPMMSIESFWPHSPTCCDLRVEDDKSQTNTSALAHFIHIGTAKFVVISIMQVVV